MEMKLKRKRRDCNYDQDIGRRVDEALKSGKSDQMRKALVKGRDELVLDHWRQCDKLMKSSLPVLSLDSNDSSRYFNIFRDIRAHASGESITENILDSDLMNPDKSWKNHGSGQRAYGKEFPERISPALLTKKIDDFLFKLRTRSSQMIPILINAMCLHDGVNASCGDRINWLMANRGMSHLEAGNLVSSECSSCKSCGNNSTTTSAPATSQPQGGNKCQVCYWNCQDIANWSTKTAAWDNESEANCKQTTGNSSCYCYGPSAQACHDGFSHIDGTSCSRRLNEIMI